MNSIIKKTIPAIFALLCLLSCSEGYRVLPFGGMNGRVEEVTLYHLRPEIWYAGPHHTDVMYVSESAYDIYGNEISSVLMDSISRVQSVTESLFENGVCVRSTQKAGLSRTVAQINLKSRKGGVTQYTETLNGRFIKLVVKERSFFNRHKSKVIEDGTVTRISTIKTDKAGYPVRIITETPADSTRVVETNTFDDRHNVTEKHIVTTRPGKEPYEEVIYTDYLVFDEQGNWTEARTYINARLPHEVLIREIKYWE